MKRNFWKVLVAAAVVLPGSVYAQQSTGNERKEVQVITITKSGNKDQKTVIEVDGDKVKVNGKDASENKDVSVRVINRAPGNVYVNGATGFSFERDGLNLFNEDPNRAMLGVVTEGDDKGAEIMSVTKESGAEKAGLKKGDIITAVGTKKIETTGDITEAIRAQKPGDKVTITFLRDGKEQKVTAELGKYKGISIASVNMPRISAELDELRGAIRLHPSQGAAAPSVWAFGRPRLGATIQDTDDSKGVKVLEVDSEGNAGKAGVRKEDVITHVDGTAISGVEELQRALREKKEGSTIRLQLLRGGRTENVEVKFPKRLKTADL